MMPGDAPAWKRTTWLTARDIAGNAMACTGLSELEVALAPYFAAGGSALQCGLPRYFWKPTSMGIFRSAWINDYWLSIVSQMKISLSAQEMVHEVLSSVVYCPNATGHALLNQRERRSGYLGMPHSHQTD